MTARPRVLVVDDERFFREAVRDALLDLSVGCELAESGEEALKLAEDPGIEAVVLDVRLPGMGGIEVLRALREQRPMLRVIVLSAHSDQELVLEALRLGAADYLAKPIHDEELRLAVTRAVEGTRVAVLLESLGRRLSGLADAQEGLIQNSIPPSLPSFNSRSTPGLIWSRSSARIRGIMSSIDPPISSRLSP